ncbi:hypothetical protein O6H91_06G034700 [Diphasiastrum complanatum]|uniref:Uncharacterized protein n=1 Tax=Diphasiastrum complanatum TaxID=34168 RepID=A0ACC2DCJ8_DIPCM|nr:hypothetical protein O6H91_06G034700 [Diphasiastrum complanatum]
MGQRKRVARHANGPSAATVIAPPRNDSVGVSADANGAREQGLSPSACQFIISPIYSIASLASDGCALTEGAVRASTGIDVLTGKWQNGAVESNGGDASETFKTECKESSTVVVEANGAAVHEEEDKMSKGNLSGVSNTAAVAVAAADGVAAASPVPGGNKDGGARSNLRAECEKALLALRRGNSTKSLRLIREACARNEASSVVHRVHGHICMRLASMIEDARTKQRHLKEALEAVKRAVALSPNSVEYAHFHAQLLYDAASDSKEYEEVVRECERGLSIEDPVDPAKESLQEEGQHELPTPKARITHYQQELRGLVQKANIASISTWMKSLGNGGSDDKLRFIQMRKIGEDPLEHCILQPKRPNEVKKSVKTPEERRKEIEVRVAAARLLQQRTEAGTQTIPADSSLESEKTAQRRSERRKSSASNTRKLSKTGDSEEKMEQVRSFWYACNAHVRESLLQVPLIVLKTHLIPSRTSLSSIDALNEALTFAEEKKTWRFWACCRCGERLTESQEHVNHVMQEHVGSLSLKLQSILPQALEQEWVEQLTEDDCTPIDGCAAMKVLLESSVISVLEDSAPEPLCSAASNGGFDCFSEASEGSLSPRDSSLENFVDATCNPTDTLEGKVSAPGTTLCLLHLKDEMEESVVRPSFHLCRGECQRDKSILWRPLEMPVQEFPLVDDEDRKKLLERIYGLFQTLIRSKCLAMDHVIKIIHYAIEEIQNMVPDPNVHYHFHHSPLYVRFLPHQALRSVHKYLCELVHACGLDRHLNEANASDSGLSSENTENDIIQDRLYLDEDFTMINLDERVIKEFPDFSLQGWKMKSADKCGKKRDSSEEIEPAREALPLMRPKDSNQKVVFTDLQLSWIYGSAEYEQQPDVWKQLQEDRAHQGREILRSLEKEFLQLQHLCERKREAISYEEALNNAESLCLREMRKREHRADGICRSYEIVLKKRHQELMARRASGLPFHEKLELDAISNILRDAQTVQVPRFSNENSLSASSTRLSDSDDEDEDPWRIHDSMQRSDSCIEVTIQRQRDSLSTEVSQLDAKIMKSMDSLQKLEQKLGLCSVFDYRSVVLPLVKSFLKARLEVEAEKDALQKSDAAREAFLEELAKDKKIAGNKVPEVGKHSKDKAKEKKRPKESRKGKDIKARGPVAGCEDSQQAEAKCESLLPDVGILNKLKQMEHLEKNLKMDQIKKVQIGNSNWHENKELQEAEFRRQVELEAEERKLNEALELQRRVEDEAKENHLAQQRKKLVDEGSFVHVRTNGHCSHSQIDSESISTHRSPAGNASVSPVLEANLDAYSCSKVVCEIEESTISIVIPTVTLEGVQHHNISGGNNSKSLPDDTNSSKQFQVEQDDEERFQADLEQAMRQSLDMLYVQSPGDATMHVESIKGIFPEAAYGDTANQNSAVSIQSYRPQIDTDEVGKGLQNEVGQYNCFLNVVIQSLWHLKRFREELLATSSVEHVHMGLRVALSAMYAESDFFQEAQMNDASEVLAVIYDCLHKAFTNSGSDEDSEGSTAGGSWDCQDSSPCIVHSLFGLDIAEQMNCKSCGLESRHLKYTSFFHNINASALRTAKIMYPESSLDELLKYVDMNHQLACDVESGGCGRQNYIHHLLRAPPPVFTTVLGWQNGQENLEDISATIDAIDMDVDVGIVYRGLDEGYKHQLVSVVCYYGQHYHCFAYNHDLRTWVMFDDVTVKVVGEWDEVVSTCRRGHLQPQVLFYEAISLC